MPPLSVEAALQNAKSIEKAASLLWDLDENRLQPGVDYQLDVQERARGKNFVQTYRKLFSFWSEQIWSRTTYATFRRLLEKNDSRLIPEYTGDEDLAFILSICQTPCIRFLRRWLIKAGHLKQMDTSNFSTMLFSMWFTPHPSLRKNSTGFQHVFCGDLKEKRLSGLHNFVRVFLEEKRGNLQYMGYVTSRDHLDREAKRRNSIIAASCHQLMGIRFSMYGRTKKLSTMFVGVSPEFEVALYTLLFVAGKNSLQVNLGPYTTNVVVNQVNGKIRVAFPKLMGVDVDGLEDDIEGDIIQPKLSIAAGKRTCNEMGDCESNAQPKRKRRVVERKGAAHAIDLNVDVEVVETELEEADTEVEEVANATTKANGAQVVDLTILELTPTKLTPTKPVDDIVINVDDDSPPSRTASAEIVELD